MIAFRRGAYRRASACEPICKGITVIFSLCRLSHTRINCKAKNGSCFEAQWPASPMVVRVAPGERSGPVGLVVPGLGPGERTDVAPVLLGV